MMKKYILQWLILPILLTSCGTVPPSPTATSAPTAATLPSRTSPIPSEAFAFTKNYTGHLESGQDTSFSIDVDGGGEVVFYLNWLGDSAPVFTLVSPDMVEITPQYALENPEIVSYEISSDAGLFLPYQTYRFPIGEVGTWQVNLSAALGEIDYQVFAALNNARTFEAELDQYTYRVGETANITASLGNNGVGLSGATVIVSIISSGGTETQLTLTDNQDGTYIGSYLIPDVPGHLTLNLTAAGEDDGVAYTRSANLVAAIAPNNLALTGEYAEEPIDDDNSLLYEKLAFDLSVNLAEPGSYLVSAELYAGDELIIHAADFFDLAAGEQTVRLLFDGQAIRDSGLDGPYTITNLFLTQIDLGITAQEAVDVLQTTPYRHTQFGLSAPPAAFGKSAPSNGATVQPPSVTLAWANSDGAISYEYCLDTIDNDECDVSWKSTDSEAFVNLDSLTTGTTYFWQVRADNFEDITYSDSANWWSFTTAP